MSQPAGHQFLWVAVLAGCSLAGCGGADDRLPREPVSGTVTFNGQPLKSGSIQLMPVQAKDAVATGGLIADGRFDVPRDVGPVPGDYRVMIFATGDAPAAADAGPGEPAGPGIQSAIPQKTSRAQPTTGLIPLRYNLQTELKAEVKAGGPNRFTFDLKN